MTTQRIISRIAIYLLSIVMIVFGIYHFQHPRNMLAFVPQNLPGGITWVYVVGGALILASIGLYGVTSYSVERRTSEIGIRMALGSSRSGVLALVMRSALWQILVGLGFGIPAALLAGHLMASQLWGVGSYDPRALAAATLVLALCATAAGFIPARRAASIEPMRALRTE